ncbi:MAG TPA: DUF1501 domain-containing protein [Saprospiraceae bacterium]|nr:DUF1501 domain-containing protein [Saprospiraceae bacterium]
MVVKKLNNSFGKGLSRRNFIGQASCAAVGYSTLLSSLVNLKAINAAAFANSSVNDGDDYKALVCFMQSGGNDSFQMLLARSAAEYAEYASTRSNLAIPQNEILPIYPVTPDGREFGVHPSMAQVQQLFNDRKLAFISNIGTLIDHTDPTDYYSYQGLPLGLYSHADQIQQWQTGLPHVRAAQGWGGKVADLIHDMNLNQDISMNVSLAGTNIFQTGQSTIEYALDPYNGSIGIYGYGPTETWDVFNILRTQAIDNMLEQEYQDMFKKTYVDVVRKSRDANLLFQGALEAVPELQTQFTDNYVSQSFHMVARTMAARQALGMKRQIFFIDFGGWDHHDEVLQNQLEMLGIVSTALNEFNTALEELNLSECVTTFTMSEFSRTLTSNGNGTDHAWGANVMVMGGKVRGGEIFGQFPSLATNGPRVVSDGVLIPTTSTDEYFAEMAMWFGVPKSDLTTIFPNLGNFYDIGSSNNPIGFLTT